MKIGFQRKSLNVPVLLFFLFGAILSFASTAHAEFWYVGAGAGAANIDGLCHGAPTQYCDDEGATLHVFGGSRVNRTFSLEGTLDIGGGFTTPGARAAGYDGGTTALFMGVNALGFIPLGERVSFYGGASGVIAVATTKLTEYHSHTSRSDCHRDWFDDDWDYYCSTHSDDNKYDSDVSAAVGALFGVEVQVSRRFYLRAQAQRYFHVDGGLAFDRRDVDFVTLNAVFAIRHRY